MTPDTDMKTCPFCDGRHHYILQNRKGRWFFYPEQRFPMKCPFYGFGNATGYETYDEALSKWNTRAGA